MRRRVSAVRLLFSDLLSFVFDIGQIIGLLSIPKRVSRKANADDASV